MIEVCLHASHVLIPQAKNTTLIKAALQNTFTNTDSILSCYVNIPMFTEDHGAVKWQLID